MVSVTKSIHIDAPVGKVFAFMQEPKNLPEIWPSMQEVRNIEPAKATGGNNYDWTYKMAGMKFDGRTETEEVVNNQRVVVTSKGGIESRWVWNYTADGNATLVTVKIDYTVPVPVLGKLAESIIVKQNDREIDVMLDNLKLRTEVTETEKS